MASLMGCKDTGYDWQTKENQKVLMKKVVSVVERLKYTNADGAKSAGDRFYLVHEPSILSPSYAKHPSITLFRYDRQIDPKAEENKGAKSNTIIIGLHSAEDHGCYVEGEHISVYTSDDQVLGAPEKLDTSFSFRVPGRKKDTWGKEMDFIEKRLDEFDKKGF